MTIQTPDPMDLLSYHLTVLPGIARVYCPPQELATLRKGLEDNGFSIGIVELVHHSKTFVEGLSEEDGQSFATMLESFDDDPDVQTVSHNAKDDEGGNS